MQPAKRTDAASTTIQAEDRPQTGNESSSKAPIPA